MLSFHTLQPQTEQRLKKIFNYSHDSESFAQSIIAYQMAELQRAALNLQLDLLAFEKKYQMASEVFYQKFSQGVLDDSEDFIVWSGLYEMLLENQDRLCELK